MEIEIMENSEVSLYKNVVLNKCYKLIKNCLLIFGVKIKNKTTNLIKMIDNIYFVN